MLLKMTASDLDLLGQYARCNLQDAFAEIVRRHLNLVYSAALRQVRSPQLAEDIAQSVFADLARNAGKLKPDTILITWLYAVTRRTAIDVIRKESRRQLREQIAVEMNNMNATANDWTQIAPLLDDAMAALDETDRSAILLRYFENKNLREVGEALGTNDDAAQKRVSRAVERLREFFSKRNVTIGAGGLAVLISVNAVQAAPAALVKTVIAATIAKSTTAGGLTLAKGTSSLMAWTKMKIAIVVGAGILTTAGIVTTSALFTSASHPSRDAREILTRVSQKYASFSSYNCNVKAVEIIDGNTLAVFCTMRLGKTNLYNVEYEQDAPTFTNKAAIWSDGTGDYWTNEVTGRMIRQPVPGPDENFSFVTADFTEGATLIIPPMFFGFPTRVLWSNWNWLFDGTNWSQKARFVKELNEKVGTTDCYVISVENNDGVTSQKMTLWVGKDDFLIYKSQQRIILSPNNAILFTQIFDGIAFSSK